MKLSTISQWKTSTGASKTRTRRFAGASVDASARDADRTFTEISLVGLGMAGGAIRRALHGRPLPRGGGHLVVLAREPRGSGDAVVGWRIAHALGGVVNFWTPLLLTCLGLLVTFRAGLWNIGVEGQITLGALCATAVALYPPALPAPMILGLALLAAALGGASWGLVVGLLKTRLGVHEIFGGTALNALANVATIYLISGPWLPAEGCSAQGTETFSTAARLPALEGDFAVSPEMLAIALVALCAILAALIEGHDLGLEALDAVQALLWIALLVDELERYMVRLDCETFPAGLNQSFLLMHGLKKFAASGKNSSKVSTLKTT